MTADFSVPELPDRYAAKIEEIALRKGLTKEEVVAEMTELVLDLAENYPNEDDACTARRLRSALREKFGIGPGQV
jgi:hypothetical protein